MTYNEFIQNILDTRGRFGIPKGEYKERHHIIPRCIGGTDDEDNLIDLYAGEHFTAHKLLAEENPTNKRLTYAYWCIVHFSNYSKICTAEQYEAARKAYSESISGNNSIMTDINTKEKMRQSQIIRLANMSVEEKKSWHANQSKSLKGRKECGWTRGMTLENNYDVISRTTAGLRHYAADHGNPALGKHWYNDGIVKIYVKEEDCPEGFVKGMHHNLPTIHCGKKYKNDLANYLQSKQKN